MHDVLGIQFSSVAQSCLTVRNTMDYFSTIKKSSNEVDETGAYYTE